MLKPTHGAASQWASPEAEKPNEPMAGKTGAQVTSTYSADTSIPVKRVLSPQTGAATSAFAMQTSAKPEPKAIRTADAPFMPPTSEQAAPPSPAVPPQTQGPVQDKAGIIPVPPVPPTDGQPRHAIDTGQPVPQPVRPAIKSEVRGEAASFAAPLVAPTAQPRPKSRVDVSAPYEAAPLPRMTPKPSVTSPTALFSSNPHPVVQPETRLTASALSEIEPLTGQRAETAGPSPTHVTASQYRSDLPQHLSRQIVEALQHMPNRPVEIALNPEELGRVRLGISSSESGIVVSVLAERPETIDLLRRHITSLETAFQNIGYSTIAFSFSGGDPGQSNSEEGRRDPTPTTSRDEGLPPASPHLIDLALAPAIGLDIRL